MEVVVVPGYGGSGEAHWQTIWEQNDPAFLRITPLSWWRPDLPDWIGAIDRAIAKCSAPPILLGHSLGCIAIAHWAQLADAKRAAGAMLAAVPDPSVKIFPHEARAFKPIPPGPLPFPTRVVASIDDPFATMTFARRQAAAWQAILITGGALGHINSDSRLGDWPSGRHVLKRLESELMDGPLKV